MNSIQEAVTESTPIPTEIKSYEEYLSTFFPEVTQSIKDFDLTPEEMGVKMAEETLSHIRNLLIENKAK